MYICTRNVWVYRQKGNDYSTGILVRVTKIVIIRAYVVATVIAFQISKPKEPVSSMETCLLIHTYAPFCNSVKRNKQNKTVENILKEIIHVYFFLMC